MEWFWVAVAAWFGWVLAPVILVIAVMLLLAVVYLFFYIWLKIENALDMVVRWKK